MDGVNNLDRSRWSQEEDVLLCKSWKFVSQCPIAGTNRRKGDLWSDVLKHFRENGGTRPSKDSLASRWKTLKVEITTWICALQQARKWESSGSNMHDEMQKAQELWKKEMGKKQGVKNWTRDFSSFGAWEVVKGFQQFQEIPDIVIPTHFEMSTQPSPTGGLVNSENIIDEESPNEGNVRPQGRRAAKEALRKRKNAAPEHSALTSIMANNAATIKAREKREEQNARLLKDQERREEVRLQMEMQNHFFRQQEKEEEIMSKDTSQMLPIPKKYWEDKQKRILERQGNPITSPNYFSPPSFSGGYYPQPHFVGGSSQQHFAGAYRPEPPTVDDSHQQPFGDYCPSNNEWTPRSLDGDDI